MAWANLTEIAGVSISYLNGVTTPPSNNVSGDVLVLGNNSSAWASGQSSPKSWNIDGKLNISVTVNSSTRNIVVTDLVHSTTLLNATGSGSSAIQKADACFWIDEENEVACCVACYGTSYNNVWVDGKSTDSNALYQIIKDLAPSQYNWQSVPTLIDKTGTSNSLVELKSDAINDGDPVSDAALTSFETLGNINIPSIINEQMPIDPSDISSVTATYLIPKLESGVYNAIKLLIKKGAIPNSEEDADRVVNLTEPSTLLRIDSKSVSNLDENSHYYFMIKVADELGGVATSEPKDIWTGATEAQDFSYTGQIVEWTAPKTGIYLLEVWGAQGGNTQNESIGVLGGYGSYSKGEVALAQGETLYIAVGGQNGYNGGGGNYTMLLDNIPVSNAYVYNFGQAISGYTILDLSAEQKAESYYKTDAVIFTCQQYAEQITLSDKVYHHELSSSAHIDQGVDGRTYYYLGGLKRIKNIKVKYRFTSRSSQYNYLAFGLANTIQNQRTYGFINITNPTISQSYTEVSQAVDYVADYIEIETVAGVCDFKDLELSFEWA